MKMKNILLILLVAVAGVSCKKNDTVTFDIHFDADTLSIDTLELMISDVWVNYATAKDYSNWQKITNVNKQFNWHDYSFTSDSLFMNGVVLENATVLQQIRFVISPLESRGIMFMDTIDISLLSPDLGIQAIVNERLTDGGKYRLRLKWSLPEQEMNNSGLAIKPEINVVTFNNK